MIYNTAFSLTMTPSTKMSDITKTQNFCILLHCRLRLRIPCEHHVSVSNWWDWWLMRAIWQSGHRISIPVWWHFITCILVLQLVNSLQKHGVHIHRICNLKPTQILQYFITRPFLFLLRECDTQSVCKTTEEQIRVFFIVKKCKIFVSSY